MSNKPEPSCPFCGLPLTVRAGIQGVCKENKRLKKIIKRAKVEFYREGSDQLAAIRMMDVLEEVDI
jgi:hypothetical protein